MAEKVIQARKRRKKSKRSNFAPSTLYEGQFKRLVSRDGWEFVERVKCCGIVAILAVTGDRKVILVEQFRVPVGKNVIEFPAGLADKHNGREEETLEDAAKRELLEETGYLADKMIPCISGPVSSSSSSDIMVLFRAIGLKKVAEGGGDHTESITVHEVALSSVDRWLLKKEKSGVLIDPKVYSGLYFLKNGRH